MERSHSLSPENRSRAYSVSLMMITNLLKDTFTKSYIITNTIRKNSCVLLNAGRHLLIFFFFFIYGQVIDAVCNSGYVVRMVKRLMNNEMDRM
jgi:hypothetical protein